MKTGIVILNYNDFETTKEILDRIKEFNILDKVILVDNNSTDDSYNKLKKYESNKIVVINSGVNKGYSYGNNIGVKALINENIDNIIISNPDIIFQEEDIIKLINRLEDENVAIIAPTVMEKGELTKGWKFPRVIIDALSNLNFFGRYFKKLLLYRKEHYETDISKVDVVSRMFFYN